MQKPITPGRGGVLQMQKPTTPGRGGVLQMQKPKIPGHSSLSESFQSRMSQMDEFHECFSINLNGIRAIRLFALFVVKLGLVKHPVARVV